MMAIVPTPKFPGILVLLPALLGIAFLPRNSPAAVGSEVETLVVDALVRVGFENVSVRSREGAITVWFENRVFRNELIGLGAGAFLVASAVPSETRVELIPENRQVPLLLLAAPASEWLRFLGGESTAEEFAGRLTIQSGDQAGGTIRDRGGLERYNRSSLRSDVAVGPGLRYQIGFLEENFRWAFYLYPEWKMSPAPGTLLTLGAKIQLHNEIEPCENGRRTDRPGSDCQDKVAPGRALASWGGWLPGQVLAAASGGLFPNDRYGVAAEFSRFVLDGALELHGTGNLSGDIQFLSNEVRYSDMSAWAAFAGATYYFPHVDLQAKVIGGHFLESAWGARVDVSRRFAEVEFSLFMAVNEFNGKHDNKAGAVVRFALPVRRLARPSVFRPATVPDFSVDYSEERRSVTEYVDFVDGTAQLRERLFPRYLRNNLELLREGRRQVEGSR